MKGDNEEVESESDKTIVSCWFCGCKSSQKHITKHPGLGLLCALCVTKMKCFQMF